MMKEVVVFCCVVVFASAYVGQAPLEPKPEKFKDEPGCYFTELDRVVPFGEKVAAKSFCQEYTCNKDVVNIIGCVKIAVPGGCKEIQNDSLPFPDCCPYPDCPL